MSKKEYKIYTKGGDNGTTSLLGGTRVPKYHERIEAYGTLDELNAFIGLLRDQEIESSTKLVLKGIQEKIFVAEAILAADQEQLLSSLPPITQEDIRFLENEIDKMNETLPELKHFILPGGHIVVSYAHVARTICRRAERLTIKCCENYSFSQPVVMYLNRLSDYFFVLARKFTYELNLTEYIWKP